MALSLNILQLVIILVKGKITISYINIGFIAICMVGIYIMYKKEGLTAKIATITNAYSLSL